MKAASIYLMLASLAALAVTPARVAAAPPTAPALPVMVLNDTNDPPYTTAQRDGYVDRIAGEAFRRAGFELRLVKLPAERGLRSANAGDIDGDMARIAGLDAQYPNLVRVPEKLLDWEFVAFGRAGSTALDWSNLQSRAIGHIKGWKIYEQKTAGAPAVVATVDAAQLFRLLASGRIDTALYERWLGMALLRELQISGMAPLEPPLARREMFIYLHQRHARLVPQLARALAGMKADGFTRRAQALSLEPFAGGRTR